MKHFGKIYLSTALFTVVCLVQFTSELNAQGFTEVFAGSLTPVEYGSVAWGDYDNDGDLDILVTGTTDGNATGAISKIYQNTGSGFTEVFAGSLTGVDISSVAWGDYDNDGDLDILLTGRNSSSAPISKIYQNTGSGFSEVFAGSLTAVRYSSIAWGDYDNDGDLDILLTGMDVSNAPISKIYQNNGSGFAEVYAGSLTNVHHSSVAWGDYDNDGDLDILLSGGTGSGDVSKIYQNTGGGFTEVFPGSLSGVDGGSSAWGDYDNDGDLDILLAGYPYLTKIYQNTGSSFTLAYNLTGIAVGSAAWGDYDNDGDLDIFLTGDISPGGRISSIFQNTGSGFTELAGTFLVVEWSNGVWGDYDNDGDLDVLLIGYNNGRNSKLYRNDATTFNSPPTAPSGLSALTSGSDAALQWSPSTDAQTPQNGLTYNLRIGTTLGSINTQSPMANISTGYRRVARLGGVNQNTSWTINDLADGTYYWSVQAVDNAFAGSAFASEGTFTIGAPTVISVSPAKHALNVTSNTNITVIFSTTMNTATFTSSNIIVKGMVSGKHAGTITPNGTTGFTFNPAVDFIAGEIVTVDVSSAIQNSIGQNLTNGYHWSFTIATGLSAGTFEAKTDYTAGDLPKSVFISKLDSDPFADLGDVNYTSSNASFFQNNGSGGFVPNGTYTTGTNPYSMYISDLDGIGGSDLAVTNYTSNTISIFKNNGGGTFTGKVDYPTGSSPRCVVIADLDGDGDGDLVNSNRNGGGISILRNNGDGTFAANVNISTGSRPFGVFITDMDNDGDNDIAVANVYSNKVSVLKNNGNGTFAPKADYTTGNRPFTVFAADLDGDGDADLAVTNVYSNSVSVLKNNGNGTFAAKVDYQTGTKPYGLFITDVDGINRGDLVVANYSSKSVSVLKNNGDGTFGLKVNYATGTGPFAVFAADVDGDGLTDLATANSVTDNISVLKGKRYTLTVNAINGTVAKSPDQTGYTHGTQVTLTATPDAGYHFIGWSGDASGTNNPLILTMDENKTVTANFAANTLFSGELWGMTNSGGTNDMGVIFNYDPSTNTYTKKVDLSNAGGSHPVGSLMQASNGKLYGGTSEGGINNVGVLFEYDITGNTYTKKIDMSSTTGSHHNGNLIQASNGKLYGLTEQGGSSNVGVLFEYDITTNTYTKKIDLSNANGYNPLGSLMEASNGKLYGMLNDGGANGAGVLFEYDVTSNGYTIKINFNGTNGAEPFGNLIEVSAGKLYGMTRYGGTSGFGTLFEYDITSNSLTKKFDFSGVNGTQPLGSLIKATNGKLYGLTATGGTNNKGVLFEYEIAGNIYTKRNDFDGTNGNQPSGSLIQASNGKIYGLTFLGGANDKGVLFEYDITGNIFTKKIDLTASTGSGPYFTHLIETITSSGPGIETSSNWAYFSGGTNNPINSLSFFDGDKGIFVGDNGTISRTQNGGTEWTVIEDDSLLGNLYSVSAHTDSATAVLCGANGLIKRTTDYGATWTTIPSGTSSNLNGLTDDGDNYSQDIIYAVGDDGVILKSTDDGLSWVMQTSNTSLSLQSVSFFNADTGIISGVGVILRTLDGGLTWTPSPVSLKASLPGSFMAAYSTTRSNVKGNSCVTVGSAGSVERSTDFGLTWITALSGTTNDLNSVAVVEGVYYAVGDNGTLIVSNTGEVWDPLDSRTLDDIGSVALKEKGVQFDEPVTSTGAGTLGIHTKTSPLSIQTLGQNSCAGKTYTIKWSGGDPAVNVSLKLYSKAQKSTSTIIVNLTANDGSYQWTIPANTPAGTYDLFIEQPGNPNTWAYSATSFTIIHCTTPKKPVVKGFVTKESSLMSSRAAWKHSPSLPFKQGDPIRDIEVSLGKKPSGTVANKVTDSTGAYEFTDIEPGEYELSVTPPPGSYVAFPPEVTYSFTLAENDTIDEMNFRLMLTAPDGDWKIVDIGTTVDIFTVFACNQDNAVAAGDSGKILFSTDGGATWDPSTFYDSSLTFGKVSLGPGSPVKGIKVSCTNGWGKGIAVGGGGTIYHTTDAGSSWQLTPSGTNLDLNAIEFFDENIFVAAGESTKIIRSTDGGLTWNPVTIIDTGSGLYKQSLGPGDPVKGVKVSCTNGSCPKTGIAVGGGGTIYRSLDNGATWYAVNSGTGADLNTIDFFDENNVIVGGDGVVLHSSDAGISWNVAPENQGNVQSIVTVDPNSAYGVGNGGGILFTPDQGLTWDVQSSPLPMTSQIVSGTSEDEILSSTTGLLGIAVAPFSDNYARVLLAFGEGGTMIRRIERTSESGILSLDDGWNLLSLPVHPFENDKDSLFRFAQGPAFAYDNGYSIAESLSAGRGYWLKFDGASTVGILGTTVGAETVDVNARWNIVGSVSADIDVTSISSIPPGLVTSNFFGYGGGTYNASSILSPGKGYWVKVNGPGKLIFSVESPLSSNRIKIVPTEELPPPPPGGEPTLGVIPVEYSLHQNFPNPFNPSSMISFDLPKDSKVSLKVYDLLGRVVNTLVDNQEVEAGSQQVEFNAGNLAGGIYFYRLTAQTEGKTFTDVKKMLLLK